MTKLNDIKDWDMIRKITCTNEPKIEYSADAPWPLVLITISSVLTLAILLHAVYLLAKTSRCSRRVHVKVDSEDLETVGHEDEGKGVRSVGVPVKQIREPPKLVRVFSYFTAQPKVPVYPLTAENLSLFERRQRKRHPAGDIQRLPNLYIPPPSIPEDDYYGNMHFEGWSLPVNWQIGSSSSGSNPGHSYYSFSTESAVDEMGFRFPRTTYSTSLLPEANIGKSVNDSIISELLFITIFN